MQQLLALLLTILCPAASAHQGHGESGLPDWLHYVLEPAHLISLIMLVAVLLGYRFYKKVCCHH